MSFEHHLQADTPSAQLEGIKLLIVDDSIDTQTLFAFILEDNGAEVIAVTSSEEALAAIKQKRPDLLISDINLAGEDGYSLIRQIRNLNVEQGGQIPAIAVSGIPQEKGSDSSFSEFQLHLVKPVDPTELVRAAATLTRGQIPV